MILFIDDEPRWVESYVDALSDEGFTVECVSAVDTAWYIFVTESQSIELIVLDIMMPPGRINHGQETYSGRGTGERLYEKIRGFHPIIPIVVLTNLSVGALKQTLPREPNVLVMHKYETLPRELVQAVRKLLGR